MIGLLVANKYRVVQKIGSGSFGDVYNAINIMNGDKVALKVEPVNSRFPRLEHEFELYRELEGGDGIPHVWHLYQEHKYQILVMDLLGPSLEDLFRSCSSRFTIKTVLMLADQMIRRLEYLHGKNFVHCDVKPHNFLMGRSSESHKLYLIDFGLAKQYRCHRSLVHISYREDNKMIGTARYASIRAHLGCELSRRDDMEMLGYVMIYFLRGSLPWQGITGCNNHQRLERIYEQKMSTTVGVLCKGLPQQFGTYLVYCRNLQFKEKPDYKLQQSLFRELFRSLNLQCDNVFDWMLLEQPEKESVN